MELIISGPSKLCFPSHQFLLCLVLYNHILRQNPSPIGIRIDHRTTTDDSARIQNRIASYIDVIAEQCAEFSQAGIEWLAIQFDSDIALDEFDIGDLYSGAQMRFVAKDRVSYVVKMRCNGMVEQQCILNLGRIAYDTIVSQNHIFTNVGVMADFAVSANDGRAFNHRAILDHCALADEDVFSDVRDAFATVFQSRLQIGL